MELPGGVVSGKGDGVAGYMTGDPITSGFHEKNDAATKRLFHISQSTMNRTSENIKLVKECVAAGADVTFHNLYADLPILHDFVQKGYAECVEACLATDMPIDFNKVRSCECDRQKKVVVEKGGALRYGKGLSEEDGGVYGEREAVEGQVAARPRRGSTSSECGVLSWSLLHCLLLCPSTGKMTRILKAFVRRLTVTHPDLDSVDWESPCCGGRTFLQAAAHCERLSYVWPVLRNVPDFAGYRGPENPYQILDPVYASDWNRLSRAERQNLQPMEIIGEEKSAWWWPFSWFS